MSAQSEDNKCNHSWEEYEEFRGGGTFSYVGGSGVHEGYGHDVDYDYSGDGKTLIFRKCKHCLKIECIGERE